MVDAAGRTATKSGSTRIGLDAGNEVGQRVIWRIRRNGDYQIFGGQARFERMQSGAVYEAGAYRLIDPAVLPPVLSAPRTP